MDEQSLPQHRIEQQSQCIKFPIDHRLTERHVPELTHCGKELECEAHVSAIVVAVGSKPILLLGHPNLNLKMAAMRSLF
ncbi:hypothetical protein D3C86_1807650 [compost metagenome]